MISKNDEAKMVLYNVLPKKEYERIFMYKTAKDVWNSLIITHQESKDLLTVPLDELIGNLKAYKVVLENDSEDSKIKKEKYKSLALKARKVSSDEEESCWGSDEEYVMSVRYFKKMFKRRGKFVHQPYDDKKNIQKVKEEKKGKEEQRCFKCGDPNHFISDCPKHSFNDQKAFVGGCWSDSEEEDDSKKDEICRMALDNNEVLFDTLYYSSSSLDSESLQNEYNKLCKISLRIINKNKLLKAKNEILNNKVCEVKSRIERLEKNKEVSVECESCAKLHSKIESLSLKLAKFENSIHFLQEMIEKQRTQKDKKGLGFTKDITSTSNTKTGKLSQESGKMPIVEPADPVSSAEICENLDSNIIKRTSSVQITKKSLPNATIENMKQTPVLKLGQELGKIKKPSLEYFKVFGSKCFILNTKDYLAKFDLKSTEGVFLGYSPNSKAYIILNKETIRIKESLTIRFDESPPPKSSPLVDDDIIESQIIENQIKDVEDKENGPLNKEIINIKESKDHPIETVIGNLNERTLRSQVQNQSNFFYFMSSVEPKNIKEAIKDESWTMAM
ncbi:zf-CCHC domain-containing protein [Tanacetum coccineum]